MSNSNVIVELKERSIQAQNRNHDGLNGDYTVAIPQNVTLFKGDSLQIKSAFIDTHAENSNKITVNPDKASDGGDESFATVSLTIGYYINDWGGAPTSQVALAGGGNVAAGTLQNTRTFLPSAGAGRLTPNGRNYVNCEAITLNPALHEEINSISLVLHSQGGSHPCPAPRSHKGYRILYLQYVSPRDATDTSPLVFKKLHLHIKTVANMKHNSFNGSTELINFNNANKFIITSGNERGAQFTFPFPTEKGTFGPDPAGQKNERQEQLVFLDSFTKSDMTAGTNYQVKPRVMSRKIEAKEYEPDELAITLSQAFSALSESVSNEVDKDFYSDNKLLVTSQELRKDLPYGGATAAPDDLTSRFRFYSRDDGQELAIVGGGGGKEDIWVGASQFDIKFQDNQFLIHQIHMPILDVDSNNVTISHLTPSAGGAPAIKTYSNKHSGVFFMDMQPHDLWFDQMKIKSSILVTMAQGAAIDFDASGTSESAPALELLDGVHITGDMIGLSSLVSKPVQTPTAAAEVQWDRPRANFQGEITIEDETMPILSDPVFESNVGGYYQLEVDTGINNTNIVGKDIQNNKIKAIVSRFYTQDSYTSCYNEGAIAYTHQSNEPLQLSNFNVRILNGDGELASLHEELGDDNTIFMEVIRGQM